MMQKTLLSKAAAGKYYRVDYDDPEFKKQCGIQGAITKLPSCPIVYFQEVNRAMGYSLPKVVKKDFQMLWLHPTSGACYINFRGVSPDFSLNLELCPESGLIDSLKTAYDRQSTKQTGWDPEIFAVDENNEMIPAFRFLPGKNAAETMTVKADFDRYTRGKVYNDGFQAEFTTTPIECHGWGFDQLHIGLVNVLHAARQFNPKAKLTLQNFFEVPSTTLMQCLPEQVELGCMPSLNAYNTNPFDAGNPFEFPYRMAGGHVHLGINGLGPETALKMVQAMDWLVALPAVGMFAEIDDPRRRQFYGRAGEYRLPKHGLEYRTLSNAWMGHPSVAHLLMNWMRFGSTVQVRAVTYKHLGTCAEEVKEIIDTCDVKGAREIFHRNKLIWEILSHRVYGSNPNSDALFTKCIMEGVQAGFPNFRDIEKNWKLTGNSWERHSDNSKSTWAYECNNRTTI